MALHMNKTIYSTHYDHADSDDDVIISIQTYSNLSNGLSKGIPITLFIIGIIANAVLIIYLLRSGRFKSPLFMLITSLSVTDFGTCFGALSYIVFLYPRMEIPNSEVMCRITSYVTGVLYLSSVYHLVLFACLRYTQLVHPLWARAQVTWQGVLKACAVIWCFFIIVQLYFPVLQQPVDVTVRNTTEKLCAFTGNARLQYSSTGVYGFFLPSFLIVAIHIVKEIRLNWLLKKSLTVPDDHRLRSDPRALTIVVVLYYITWIPNIGHLYSHTYAGAPYLPIHNFLHFGLRLLTYFNSVIDPFVYCFASKTVRGDIFKFFCGGSRSSVKLAMR